MMRKKIAFYSPYDKRTKKDGFLNDFDDSNEYVTLSKYLIKLGCEVHSLDVFDKQKVSPDICVFMDIPPVNINRLIDRTTQSIVLLRESESISRENFEKKRHAEFDLILTWKRALIDNVKYLPYPSTRLVSFEQLVVKDFLNRKLCVLINSNLFSKLDGELYSLRKKIMIWFHFNHPEDFDLWGFDWDRFKVVIFGRVLFSFKKPSKFIPPLYNGVAEDKINTISQYKFSICFENTNNVNDYISEKIFDAFLAQNVPIYYGAPNITDVIPSDCFIDYRDFKSEDELYSFLKSMPDDEYLEYIAAINKYMKGSKVQKFSLKNWVDIVSGSIQRLSI